MSEKPTANELRRQLEGIQNHKDRGNQRILAYYRDSYDPPEDLPELEEPPDKSMMREGIELINLSHETMGSGRGTIDDPEKATELILYGVGMEHLLTGIYLQIEQEKFIQKLEDTGKSPLFGQMKGPILADFRKHSEDALFDRLVAVLDIVKEHRDNEVHLGFHQHVHTDHRPAILEVTYELGSLYLKGDSEALEEIGEKVIEYYDESQTGSNSGL